MTDDFDFNYARALEHIEKHGLGDCLLIDCTYCRHCHSGTCELGHRSYPNDCADFGK